MTSEKKLKSKLNIDFSLVEKARKTAKNIAIETQNLLIKIQQLQLKELFVDY